MKISLEFNSVREMRDFYDGINFVPRGTIREAKLKQEKPDPAPVAETPAEAEPDPAPAAEKPAEETAPAAEEPKEETAPAADKEQISVVEVRKMLKTVNKMLGKNAAKEWIAAEGFSSLTDIFDQEVLKRLSAKAEEVINAE